MNNKRQGLRLLGGFRVGRFFGVEIIADWSVLLIVGLIAFGLGTGLFPTWHPDWPPALVWGTSLVSALLFLVSIGIHELSHALVGRWQGVPVRRITLFVFGGMAHAEREPGSPKAELLMTIVGPLSSLAIGVGASFAGIQLAGANAFETVDPEVFLAGLSPTASLLLWLGPINITLAIFNLVPGFPLDGGRVFRAIVWWVTGDLHRATRLATNAGRGFGWGLVMLGLALSFGLTLPGLGTGLSQGLWLMLIGWFLANAARASYSQLTMREALGDLRVSDVMRTHIDTVDPELDVSSFVREHVMQSDQTGFPVVDGGDHGGVLGMVTLNDIRRAPRERWHDLRVRDVMVPADRLDTLSPGASALDALNQLTEHDQVPIVDHGRLVGLARRQDVMKWVILHGAEPTQQRAS